MTSADLRQLLADPKTSAVSRRAITDALHRPASPPAGQMPPVESPLEERFLALWQELGGPELRREFAFAEPARKFRFDFAYLPKMIAVEIEGGLYKKSRHTSPIGFEQDCVKYNLAAHLGYVVFRLTSQMIIIEQVQAIVGRCR